MATPAEILALATQYHATGNLALAEQFAASILSEDPNHAGALHLLGMMAQEKGDSKQAVVYLKKSLTANGADPLTWQHMGDILLAGGDTRAGITYYEEALRLRPDFAEGYNTLGIAYQQVGEWDRAASCFRQAIYRLPAFAPPYNNLGNVLRKQKLWTEALEAFKQGLQLWPDSPEIAFNLGTTYHDLRDLDQAVIYYRQALKMRPSYAADVSNSLATALKDQGHVDEAVSQFQETLRLFPNHPMASYNLGELAVQGAYRFKSEEITSLKNFLASGRGSPLERSLSAFTLGAVLNQQGVYDEAFRFYQEANDQKKRLLRDSNQAHDATAQQALVDQVISAYGRSYFERTKKWGTDTEVPIFIVGMPFSGAAVVAQILASQPQVAAIAESGDIYRFLTQGTEAKTDGLCSTSLLPNVRATRSAAADYLQRLLLLGQGAARVTVTYLDNYLHLGLFATLFSRARIIHCRRDPRDVALSCYFQNFQDMPFAWSLDDIAAYCRSHENVMAHWSRMLPGRIHDVVYEELVSNQEIVIHDLLTFCGLPPGEKVPVISSNQGQPVGHWQHYRTHLARLFPLLEKRDE